MRSLILASLLAPLALFAQGGSGEGGTTPPTVLYGTNGITTTKIASGKWRIGNTNTSGTSGSYVAITDGTATNLMLVNPTIGPLGGYVVAFSNDGTKASMTYGSASYQIDFGASPPAFQFNGLPMSSGASTNLSDPIMLLNRGAMDGRYVLLNNGTATNLTNSGTFVSLGGNISLLTNGSLSTVTINGAGTTINSPITAANASSVAPSAVANVGTLDVRYTWTGFNPMSRGTVPNVIYTNTQVVIGSGPSGLTSGSVIPAGFTKVSRIGIQAYIGGVTRPYIADLEIGIANPIGYGGAAAYSLATTNWNGATSGLATLPIASVGVIALTSNQWTLLSSDCLTWSTNFSPPISLGINGLNSFQFYPLLHCITSPISGSTTNLMAFEVTFTK